MFLNATKDTKVKAINLRNLKVVPSTSNEVVRYRGNDHDHKPISIHWVYDTANQKNHISILTFVRLSPLVDEGLGVCPLWWSCGRGGSAGIRIISSHSEKLEVSIQLVIEGIVGVGGFKILPVLLAEDADVITSHGIPAEVGHGLELVVERWLPEFGRWHRGNTRDRWENFVTASLALFRLADLHWEVCERNLSRPWSSVLVTKLLTVTDHAAVDKWVDVRAVQVGPTGTDERDASMGHTAAPPGISVTSSGVGRQDGPILLKAVGEVVLNAAVGLPG